MSDETRQTDTQAHIFQIFSIVVERFPISIITSHIRKPHTGKSCNDGMDFRNEVFKYKPMKMLLFWINYHLCTVLDEVPPGPLKDEDVMHSVSGT